MTKLFIFKFFLLICVRPNIIDLGLCLWKNSSKKHVKPFDRTKNQNPLISKGRKLVN
jgi:hypothetical protein